MSSIKDLREQKGLTQKDIADALGIKPSNVSRYENGVVSPPPQKRKALASLLEISVEELDSFLIACKRTSNIDMEQKAKEQEERFALYRRMIILAAGGCCELCKSSAPFTDPDGRPYLQLFEIDQKNDENDYTKKYVALCPNCYQRVKVLNDKKELEKLKEIASKHDF